MCAISNYEGCSPMLTVKIEINLETLLDVETFAVPKIDFAGKLEMCELLSEIVKDIRLILILLDLLLCNQWQHIGTSSLRAVEGLRVHVLQVQPHFSEEEARRTPVRRDG